MIDETLFLVFLCCVFWCLNSLFLILMYEERTSHILALRVIDIENMGYNVRYVERTPFFFLIAINSFNLDANGWW